MLSLGQDGHQRCGADRRAPGRTPRPRRLGERNLRPSDELRLQPHLLDRRRTAPASTAPPAGRSRSTGPSLTVARSAAASGFAEGAVGELDQRGRPARRTGHRRSRRSPRRFRAIQRRRVQAGRQRRRQRVSLSPAPAPPRRQRPRPVRSSAASGRAAPASLRWRRTSPPSGLSHPPLRPQSVQTSRRAPRSSLAQSASALGRAACGLPRPSAPARRDPPSAPDLRAAAGRSGRSRSTSRRDERPGAVKTETPVVRL